MFLAGDCHKDAKEASSSSLFILILFSGGFNSSFRCWSYPFPPFKCFLMPVDLLIIHFSLFKGSGVLKISQKMCVSIINPFKLFWDYYLIQVILLNRCYLSSSGSDHFNIRKINYQFFSTVFVSSVSKLPLFFLPSHSCFFKDSDFLIMYPFICGKSLHSFLSMFLSGDSPWRCSTVSSSSSFVLFLLRWIQFKLSVLIILFSLLQMLFHTGAPLNLSLLAIHLFWSAKDISTDLCLHYQSVQDISRCYLIQAI